MTYAEFLAIPDDGRRYELVEGERVLMTSPTRWHQKLLRRLSEAVGGHVDRERLGEVYFSPIDVHLDDRNAPQPDLVYVSFARPERLADARIEGAPDLCVEILSPSTHRHDRVRKLNLYARFGVPHYWIIDPVARSIEEFVLEQGAYRPRSVVPLDGEFRPSLFPGLVVKFAPEDLPPPGVA